MSKDFEDRMLSEGGYKSYIEKMEGELANAKRIRDDNFKIAEEYIGKYESERERSAEVIKALKGLYGHTKNDMTICGLNETAKRIIAECEEEK